MKKVLVFGGSGLVGSRFIALHSQNFEIFAPDTLQADILKKEQVLKVAQEFNPDSIINFAAYTNVEEAEKQKDDKGGVCFQINAIGAKNVAEVAKDLSKHLVHISTEYVFDGKKSDVPYTEQDKPNPINWYGATKYFAEQFVLQSGCQTTIMRICMPFCSFYELKKDIARFFVEQLKNGQEIKAITDQNITPTLVDDIVNALKVLIDLKRLGLYQVASKNSVSPFKFANLLAQSFHLDTSLIKPITFEEYNSTKQAKLLKNSWLDSSRFRQECDANVLHSIEESVEIFNQQLTGKD